MDKDLAYRTHLSRFPHVCLAGYRSSHKVAKPTIPNQLYSTHRPFLGMQWRLSRSFLWVCSASWLPWGSRRKGWRSCCLHPNVDDKVWEADLPNATKDDSRESKVWEAYFENVWVSNGSLLWGIWICICICICICIWSSSPRLMASRKLPWPAPLLTSLKCSTSFTKLLMEEWPNTMSTRQEDPSMKYIGVQNVLRLKQSMTPTWLPLGSQWKMVTSTPPRYTSLA